MLIYSDQARPSTAAELLSGVGVESNTAVENLVNVWKEMSGKSC